MRPPTKNQTSIGVDNPTLDASNGAVREDDTENEDMARQEYGKEADVNYMLSRLGITAERGAPIYGEWDDSIDLQIAIESTRDAREAYAKLPPDLRAKFQTMEELLKAVENNSLVIKDEEAPIPIPAA